MIELGDYVGAEAKLRYALRFWKTNDNGRFLLAKALFMQSKNEDALAQLNRIDSGRVGENDALVLRGRVLLALGQTISALAPLNEVLNTDRNNYEATVYKGVAFRELKRYEKAIDILQSATEIDPNRLEAIYELGLTYHYMNDSSATAVVYRSLLAKDRTFAERFQQATRIQQVRTEPVEIDGVGR
jgi:tetratricopeptide (TPR) repeat protein